MPMPDPKCTCGADRTGPSAEAHAPNCPAKWPLVYPCPNGCGSLLRSPAGPCPVCDDAPPAGRAWQCAACGVVRHTPIATPVLYCGHCGGAMTLAPAPPTDDGVRAMLDGLAAHDEDLQHLVTLAAPAVAEMVRDAIGRACEWPQKARDCRAGVIARCARSVLASIREALK